MALLGALMAAPLALAAPHGRPAHRMGRDGTPLLLVPAGAFHMGSTDSPDQQPIQEVNVRAFYIARTPVTNDQFRKFVAATHYPATAWRATELAYGLASPVVNVTWQDARAYCEWVGLRLPTEAEREKAARGTDGRTFPWGNQWDPARVVCSVGTRQLTTHGPTRVGSYPANASPYGALDMEGNVWEWTSSLYRPYPYVATDGREDPKADGRRVARGASWACTDVVKIHTTWRTPLGTDGSAATTGFRCAASAD